MSTPTPPQTRVVREEIEPDVVGTDPRADPVSATQPVSRPHAPSHVEDAMAVARISTTDIAVEHRAHTAPTVRPVQAAVDVSWVVPESEEEVLREKERRIAELEALLRQEGSAEILSEELATERAHSARLEECVAKLTKEREKQTDLQGELEALRASVDQAALENAELEGALRLEREEKKKLGDEVARLQCILEDLSKLG